MHQGQMMIATPPMTQPRIAAVPAAAAAYQAPNSQPEPMIVVSEEQIAPIGPISRLRPTSAGLVVIAPGMSESSFRPVRAGSFARTSGAYRSDHPGG
jgi:hypothetical protein